MSWMDPTIQEFIGQALLSASLNGKTGLTFGDLTYKGSGKIRAMQSWPAPNDFFTAPNSEDTTWIMSPDSTKAVNILRYWGEPDHDLEVYNRNGDGVIEQLDFCGTPCEYLGVRWIDRDRFVFVMTYENFEGRGERPSLSWYSACVSLYDLASDSVHSFASDPILRRPPLYVDSMISLIWDNPVAVHFIHTTFEEAAIPGYRDGSLSYFEVTDSSSIDLRIEPNSTLARPENGLWMLSPDSSRAATVVPLPGDSTQLRIHESRGDSTVRRMYSSEATRRHLAVRWLSDDLLLVLRVDEDGHFSQRLGHRVVDGNVATAILYNFERGYQLSFGSYILMPD